MQRATARATAAPTLVALAFFASVALLAGSSDGFRFCELIHIGPRVRADLLAPCERQAGPGYDGQFYFAIAHDPFLTRPDTAASLDDSLRYRRILYPLTAWLLATGQPAALPYTLVLVNVAAATAPRSRAPPMRPLSWAPGTTTGRSHSPSSGPWPEPLSSST